MSADLLFTKISIPPSRAHLVHRQRLMRRLDESPHHRLTLINAPAGFGKTTLLCSWVEHSKIPIAWYSLDDGDNDPLHFLSYLLSAIHSVAPKLQLMESVAALRQEHDTEAIERLLTFLINEFQQLPDPVGIVLDDYHLIHSPAVDSILTLLIDRAPPSMFILLSSRAEPAFSYARLRAGAQLLEINEHDLRFTPEEASSFLREVMGLKINDEEAASLEERTEGWVAGLQLAALSLGGRQDVSSYIAGLRGTDRYILDYLADEVFARLPEVLQAFMLRISLVERFNASLCDRLIDDWGTTEWKTLGREISGTETMRSQYILDFLNSSNLFVIPLDHERNWYRFHHLFADFLQNRLMTLHPEEVPELHRRASTWFSSERFLTEAIHHALKAGEPNLAATMIEAQVKPLLSRGETRTLAHWVEALPEETLRDHPMLLFGQAWSYLMSDPQRFQAEIRVILPKLSTCLEVESSTILGELGKQVLDPARRELLGQYALLSAFLERDSQPYNETIDKFRLAESAFSEHDFFTRAFAISGMASTLVRQGNLAEAERAFARAAQLSQRLDNPFAYLVARDWEATTQAHRGWLNQAASSFKVVIEQLSMLTSDQLPLTAHAYVGLAAVLLQQNDLKGALEYVETGIDRGQRILDRDALLEGHQIHARILHALGDQDGAQQALEEGLDEARRSGIEQCIAEAEAREAMLNLAWGEIHSALRWAEKRGIRETVGDETHGSLQSIEWMALASLRVAQGALPQAEAILKRMLAELEAGEFVLTTMEVRCALSVVLQAMGKREAAQRIIAKTLLEGESEGFMRCFLDQGPRMAALLRNAASSGHSPAYVERLLEAFGEALSPDDPIDPLTERELQVLRLLSEGLTNAAIADELVIAQSTVKTHINRIYAKLGVTQRTQAVARARELNLLS